MGVSADELVGLTLTRRQIARQEIDVAIDLFFRQTAPVSAHVLACAALDQLKGIAKNNIVKSLYYELQLRDGFGQQDGYNAFIRQSYNFFKHSDRDPEAQLKDFFPEQTFIPLLFACEAYERIYGQVSWSMYILNRWVVCRNPELMKPEFRKGMQETTKFLICARDVPFDLSTKIALIGVEEKHKIANILTEGMQHIIEP